MRHLTSVVSLGLLLVGCSVQVTFPVGLACDDGECPDGQRCEAEVCVLDVPGIDGGSDATVDAGGGTLRLCGGSEAYVEDFSSARSAWLFDNIRPGMTIGGNVTLDVPEGEPEVFATSRPRFDLLESSWIAEVDPATGGITMFGIKGDGAGSLTIEASDGVLSFKRDYGVDDDGVVTVAYDQDSHRYLGFRERGGTVEFITSPDGVDLTVHRSLPTPPYAARFQSVWSLERDESGLAGSASFDNLNRVSTHSFCLAEAFRDDFDDDSFSDQWSVFSCETIEETNGEVIFTSAPGEFCVLSTSNLHDIRGSRFELELGSVFSGYFKYAIDGRFGELVVERFDGELRVSNCVAELCESEDVAAYVGERYLRFEASEAGGVTFSFSADGVDFTEVASSESFDLSAVKARFHGNVGTENRMTRFN